MKTFALAVFAMPVITGFADPPPPIPTMHAESRVVEIDVVVTDSHGKPVTDLTKQDFTIIDEGKPRAIDIFSVERNRRGSRANHAIGGLAAFAAAGIFKSQSRASDRYRTLHSSHPRSD